MNLNKKNDAPRVPVKRLVSAELGRGYELKKDYGKPMWDLLPFGPVGQIVDVLTFGARKYAPDQWQQVPDARRRYFAAMMRHLNAWWSGERIDDESGLPHLAHAGCCLVFLMWFDGKER